MVTNCSAANLLPAESTQSFTHSCTTYSLIPSDPNTPQSPAATAPLLKRGQPIGVRLLCEKAKMCRFSVSLAPSVTLSRDTFLPERLMVTNCSAADLLPAESTQSFTHSCTTYRLIPSDPNTPQSPAATAPLLKRGQPIGVRLLCEKGKMCRLSVSQAPSVTLSRDTFLPERLMVTNCSAANLLPAESTQSFTHSCTTYRLIPSDLNTPQSPAATAPLF